VAESQAIKSRKPSGLNGTRAGGQPSGEYSPNSFLLLCSYRRASSYSNSRFLTCFFTFIAAYTISVLFLSLGTSFCHDKF